MPAKALSLRITLARAGLQALLTAGRYQKVIDLDGKLAGQRCVSLNSPAAWPFRAAAIKDGG
jgi:hypothetical protein